MYNLAMRLTRMLILLVCLAILAGCHPSPVHIELRREKQELNARIAGLERQLDAAHARIRAIETSAAPAAAQPPEIEHLFTAHGLFFGRLTGGYREDPRSERDDGVVVHIVPTDQDGQTLKAAGSFRITLFDLASPQRPLVGQRDFTIEEATAAWHGRGLLFNYVLRVPYDSPPQGSEVLVRVEYLDGLTGRLLLDERSVPVR